MELEDCGFDLLAGVVVTSDPLVAFKDIDVLIGLGAFPLLPQEPLVPSSRGSGVYCRGSLGACPRS